MALFGPERKPSMDWTKLEPEFAAFQRLTEKALAEWFVSEDYDLQPIGGGASGAAVFRADLRPTERAPKTNGKYILKVSRHSKRPGEPNEIDAHLRAVKEDPQFSSAHLPDLKEQMRSDLSEGEPSDSGYAMLYRVAGGSLDGYRTTSAKDNSSLSAIAQKVSEDLLNHWTNPIPGQESVPGELLVDWLGHRLSSEQAPALHSFANRELGTKSTFIRSGEALIHPFHFAEHVATQTSLKAPRFSALLHNDLHGGNLLAYTQGPAYRNYQLIDFGLSNYGPAGFDHAYLELWTLLTAFAATDAAPLIGLLKVLDEPERNHPQPDGTAWAYGILKSIREGITVWQSQTTRDRQDDVDRQFRLARVF